MQDPHLTQEILQRIDTLADKLGTTAEYLWPALVLAQRTRGIGGAVLCCAVLVPMAWLLVSCVRSETRQRRLDAPSDDGIIIIAVFLAVGLLAAGAMLALECLPRIVAPEAYALGSLLP